MPSKLLFTTLQQLRAYLYRRAAGKGIGKKFPILWKTYDKFYQLLVPQKTFLHEVGGNKILIDLTEPDYRMRRILEDYTSLTEYEPATSNLVRSILREGDTVLDIGASIGPFSLTMSKLVGETGRIYAFEPTEMCFNYLCENIKINNCKNIYPYKLGAWDKDELIRAQLATKRPIWANGIRLDDFLAQHGVEKVDFIKMDIDGAEPWALRGLMRTFEKNPHLKMVMEYYPLYIRRFGGDPEEVLDIVRKYFDYKPIEGDYGDGYWNFYCVRKPIM